MLSVGLDGRLWLLDIGYRTWCKRSYVCMGASRGIFIKMVYGDKRYNKNNNKKTRTKTTITTAITTTTAAAAAAAAATATKVE